LGPELGFGVSVLGNNGLSKHISLWSNHPLCYRTPGSIRGSACGSHAHPAELLSDDHGNQVLEVKALSLSEVVAVGDIEFDSLVMQLMDWLLMLQAHFPGNEEIAETWAFWMTFDDNGFPRLCMQQGGLLKISV
jgi:hypothetical protein